MRDWVGEWVQQGRIYVWRYAVPNRSRRGWHFTGDPLGCASLRNLIDRMSGGAGCYRTLTLQPLPREVWEVPNFGEAKKDAFTSLRVQFDPAVEAMSMAVEDQRLIMTFGDRHVKTLRAAFADVEIGRGDFGIGTSEKRNSETWWFWWMPRSIENEAKKR